MTMIDYTIQQLEEWDNQINKIVKSSGLDCYPQEYEVCSYEDMICYEAYVGMPSHYPHWSYGKKYERKRTLYEYNLEGLPYEMVINSNPCIAYLMRDNTLLLQILTMAHVYGHNDFFKNNRLFAEGTRAEYTLEMFKNHANRIRDYIKDPAIGYEKVERILDAGHALKYHTTRVVGEKYLTHDELKKMIIEKYHRDSNSTNSFDEKKDVEIPDLNKIPLEPTEDIMNFLIENSHLEEWEKDILEIVMTETKYFIPQIETKIMNEGWASFWHYRIINQLELHQSLHLEFLNRHNQVIRPFLGSINPYFIGFKLFEAIEKEYGTQKLFEVRKMERDDSFIRKYLTEELCKEMNLFQYAKNQKDYIIEEISDRDGWKKIRDSLANSVGMGDIPCIKVEEVLKGDGTLVLTHEYDGRELRMTYAHQTLKYLSTLWGNKVILNTILNGNVKSITCNKDKIIY
ncbi:SpoVR family protein [Vallitalea okinawensis]|uniref:SpoVR family protein n=1 Tax=Vallitalea okinawensis TaxID=2078660 RepID=UPI002E8E1A46|nr:SpoVR family protein [Vallitalea okinawensis]